MDFPKFPQEMPLQRQDNAQQMSDSRLLPGSYECLIFENEPTTQNVEIEQLHEQVQRQGRQLRTQTVVLAACGLAVMLIAILLLTHRQILTGGSK